MRRSMAALFVFTALCLACCTSALAWEAPCFSGTPDWQYADGERAVQIKKVSDSTVTYFVADVQLADASGFHTALSSGLSPVSDIASKTSAVLAVNGDDYGTHQYGIIIRNGQLLRTHDTTRNMLIVDAAGDMSVRVDRKGEPYETLGQQMIDEGVRQTFEFGPELVRNGQAVAFSPDFDVISVKDSRKEPRTAIGQIGQLHYIIIVVDGRQDGYSLGMSLQELQQLFIDYGAKTAMNLDGGGSAEMWFMGEVISSPSGGNERNVSDIIWF